MNFDLERMKKAMEGERFLLPDNLSREELRKFLCDKAKEIRAKEKQ
jgi:hypothetical protein